VRAPALGRDVVYLCAAMKLYGTPNSTFTRRVRMALLEKNVEAEFVALDFPGGEHRKPPYLAKNPYGRFPTLEDGDFVLFESTAILDYLESKHPTPPLLPGDPKARALATMHVKLCDLQIGVHANTLFFPVRFLPPEKWNQAEIAAARERVNAHLAILETQIAGPWLLGDTYTLADLAYTPVAHFFDKLELTYGDRIAAWRERLAARPSAMATVPAR